MTILVKLANDSAESWGIVELQGDLESRETNSPLQSKFVGDLHYTKQGDIPTLIIGHHILYGKAIDLDNPYAVLEKRTMNSDNGAQRVTYFVKAIVRRKLIFKVRPKPIIASVSN